ncbi:ribulose-phosphate 3-epimerase [Candidatus Peregrinibacteria bacterium RIFOXYA12_FULL_33_12]|nr:MAG: ribulose-phosphate 3-epimerase [Candidatus Peregrinibacteria bacterium RIFOXYA12_FULL_33_12]OGJ44859.1 MAG: ribulose-phosphate 3-epimerase [Candidatus Peregrinibacteria bacterium RIFOXYA2_FULL_33_21]OGJ50561.1 MAG: ribulose-phosphate 3-epimerase [Candidatus Peregrinibacteria bacterium RIFOXYB2_FULL_33_20]
MIKIAPSILSADFGKLNEEIAAVEPYSDWIHVDVMDGHFVPNITIGPVIVKSIKSKLPLDCHLMIESPERYVENFVKAGAAHITVHQEACIHLDRNIQQIKDLGVKAGVSINPATPAETLKHVIDKVDLVLVMTVNPGFGGQRFIPEVLSKISYLRNLRSDLDIVVDGGINEETAKLVIEAGANILVAGSYIFGVQNRKKAIERLRG